MSAIKELFRSHQNNVADLRQAQEATASDLGKWLESGEINPRSLSLREMWDVFVTPQLEKKGINFDYRTSDFAEVREEMVSSMFPTATGKLIHPAVIDAYEVDTTEIRSLVTEVRSDRAEEEIVGFSDGDRPRHVEEGQPYPEAQMGEKKVKIRNQKFGVGMGLTVEMIRFDQTDELLNRARQTGTMMGDLLEEFICHRLSDVGFSEIQEADGDNAALVYNGTGVDMYAASHTGVDDQTNANLGTGGAPTITSVMELNNLLMDMKTEKGRPARIRPRVVFSHAQMADKLRQFFGAQDFDMNSAERNVNIYKGAYRIVTSQFMPSTTAWFLGDPARQFRLQWVWEPQTSDAGGDPKRDVLTSFYTSMFCGVGATDYRYVAKNAGA